MRKAFVRLVTAAIVVISTLTLGGPGDQINVTGVTYDECMHMGGRYVSDTCVDVDH